MPQPVTQIHTETQGIGLSNSPSSVKAILTRIKQKQITMWSKCSTGVPNKTEGIPLLLNWTTLREC